MNLQNIIQTSYDHPDRTFEAQCDVERDAHLVGRCLATNNRPRPNVVSGPTAGIFTINGDRVVLVGTSREDTRLYLCNGSDAPKPLKSPPLD
jgi:hypothetical protein